MDDIESRMLLSQVETWMTELEREVRAFETAVAEAEEVMDEVEEMEEVEYAGTSDGANGEIHQDLQQLERALEATERIAQLVHAADNALSEAIVTVYQSLESAPALPEMGVMPDLGIIRHGDPDVPLAEGSLILGGQYRLVQLLHQRPRLNLYLARRQSGDFSQSNEVLDQEPLVAIRELVLTSLSPQMRRQVERAAFEEFVSPMVLGSAHLPGAGDRVRVEGERHYLVMQLRRAKGERPALAVTLVELLLSKRQWPSWLDLETAWGWSVQLCRIVARLHRLGTVIGDLDPTTVLVDIEGAAQWAPVLLISWPPSPQFWPASARPAGSAASTGSSTGLPTPHRSTRIFPAAYLSANKAFAAPEMLNGVCDQRSDVYSLGAMLYLLFTRYAPASAASRMRAAYRNAHSEYKSHHNGFVPQASAEGIALIAPHLFNYGVPQVLERILLRALALDPGERYSTVFELVEALESEEVRLALVEVSALADDTHSASRVGKMVEWVKRELNE